MHSSPGFFQEEHAVRGVRHPTPLWHALFWGTCILLQGILPVATAKPPRVTPAGAFSVIPSDASPPSFYRIISGHEANFYSLTGFSQRAFPPILLVLHEKGGTTTPSLKVDAVEGGLPRITIDLPEGAEDDGASARIVTSAMLLREVYQDKAPPQGARVRVFPSWLIHGLAVCCNPRAPWTSFPAQFLSGAPPPRLEEFVTQSPPDASQSSLMRIYDETAACLVRAALNDSGKPAFREWICESSREKQPEWPAGWDTASVERGWLLAMAGSARTEEKESPVLPAGLTLERYDTIIARVKTPGHSLGLLSREKGGSGQVSLIAGLLTVLRQSANPAALPLIDRSISFCRDLGHLSKRKIEAEEQSLRNLREDIVKRSRGIGSFLDWYEASKLPVRSGLFDNLPEGMRMKGKKGPVGDRLDAVESRGW